MIQTITPISPKLRDYIECYIVYPRDIHHSMSYVSFPNKNTCISLFKGVEIKRGNLSAEISSSNIKKNEISIEIVGKFTKPFYVSYNGFINEISIIFKPLGVNRFLRGDLVEYAPSPSQPLENPNWKLFAEELFKEENLTKGIKFLECFLLENLSEIDDGIVKKAVLLIEDIESDYTIQEVADLCGVTTKFLQRNFRRILTCTPSQYKRIAKFRHSISKKISEKQLIKLTDLSYQSLYSDQSYFIREYKKLSGMSPKVFFKRVSVLADESIIWEFR